MAENSNLKLLILSVLFSALAHAIAVLFSNLIYHEITSSNPLLEYDIAPPAHHVSVKIQTHIYQGFFCNSGDRIAEKVIAVISFPSGCSIIDGATTPTDKTVKPYLTYPDSNLAEIKVPDGLSPPQGVFFSFLTEGPDSANIKVDLSGKGIVGSQRIKPGRETFYTDRFIYILMFSFIFLITLFVYFLLYRTKKIYKAEIDRIAAKRNSLQEFVLTQFGGGPRLSTRPPNEK